MNESGQEGQSDPMLQELDAMKSISGALKTLPDDAARRRVLGWVMSALGLTPAHPVEQRPSIPAMTTPLAQAGRSDSSVVNVAPGERPASLSFETVADLYAAAQPRGDAEKALVVAYWFQVIKGESDFDSQSVNGELRHLGYGVSNITQAFNALINKKPQLVIQTRKGGTTQQARKRLKLTSFGQQTVERMIRAGPAAEDDVP